MPQNPIGLEHYLGVFPPLLNADYRKAQRHWRECQRKEREAVGRLEVMARELEPLLRKEENEGLTPVETLTRDSLFEAVYYFLTTAQVAIQRATVAEQVVDVYEDYLPLLEGAAEGGQGGGQPGGRGNTEE